MVLSYKKLKHFDMNCLFYGITLPVLLFCSFNGAADELTLALWCMEGEGALLLRLTAGEWDLISL